MKKLLIFLLVVHLVYSEIHSFITTYTEIRGQSTAGTPEFSAVTTLDGHPICYYDSNIKKMIPEQNWMKEFASTHMWKEYTDIREKQQQIYKNNSHDIMETFNQSQGVHVYQRVFGCEWDDETGVSQGFDDYVYDGEDFISLDLKKLRYIASVEQASPTVMKWNNDRKQLISLKQYYDYECVYWLRKFLHLSKATSEKTESASDASYIMYLVPVIILVIVGMIVLIGLIGLFVLWKCRNKLKAYCKTTSCSKSKPSPEHAQAQESLQSTPSDEMTSCPETCDLSVSGAFMFPLRDQQYHFPEPSLSQFLTGGPISPNLPDN